MTGLFARLARRGVDTGTLRPRTVTRFEPHDDARTAAQPAPREDGPARAAPSARLPTGDQLESTRAASSLPGAASDARPAPRRTIQPVQARATRGRATAGGVHAERESVRARSPAAHETEASAPRANALDARVLNAERDANVVDADLTASPPRTPGHDASARVTSADSIGDDTETEAVLVDGIPALTPTGRPRVSVVKPRWSRERSAASSDADVEVVRVHIGRVEVHALVAPETPRPQPMRPRSEPLSLERYLTGEGRR